MKNNLSLSVDITLHILILFTFLSVFFFLYISKLEKDNLNGIIQSAVSDNTASILTSLDKIQTKIPNDIKVNWKELQKYSDKFIADSKNESPNIKKNNERLMWTSGIFIGVMMIVLITMIIVGRFVLHYDLGLKHILIMNLIIFSIAGLLEFLFFKYVASQYIPVTPDVAINEVLNEMKKKI